MSAISALNVPGNIATGGGYMKGNDRGDDDSGGNGGFGGFGGGGHYISWDHCKDIFS